MGRSAMKVTPSLKSLLLWVTAFAVLNAAIRLAAGLTLSMDDAKTNLFTQVWQWGYQPDNPPLFEWLSILLKPLLGGPVAFQTLKYLALIGAAGFLYKAAERLATPRMAFLTSLGTVLLNQIGWNFHQAFTHSALLVLAIAAGLWAVLRTLDRPSLARVLVLGLVVGFSLLTKYNAALFWLGVLGASLSARAVRLVVLKPVFLMVPMVAALLLLPHLVWLLGQTDAYRASVAATLGFDDGPHWVRALSGVGGLLTATLLFMMPFLLVIAGFWRQPPRDFLPREAFLLRISGFAWGALLVAIVLFGVDDISERYLIPVLMPAYMGIMLATLRRSARAPSVVLWASSAMAVLVVLVRGIGFVIAGPPMCTSCREFIPYTALKEPIEEMIPKGAVLIVREENTGGNLVEMFPSSPVRVFTSLHLTNPIKEDGLPCYLVWSKDMIDPDIPLEPPIQYMETDPSTVMVTGVWTHPFKPKGWRTTVWGITPIEKKGLYNEFCTTKR